MTAYKDRTPEQKAKGIAATRRWQQRNPEKVRITHRRAAAAWAKRNPDKIRSLARSRYAKDPEAARAKNARNYRNHAAKRIAAATRWARENPERAKLNADNSRWRRSGVDPQHARSTLLSHSGRCDCCGTDQPGGRHRWNVDHDHTTGAVRGVLCLNCNTAIGKLGDTLEGVLRAVKYLQRT